MCIPAFFPFLKKCSKNRTISYSVVFFSIFRFASIFKINANSLLPNCEDGNFFKKVLSHIVKRRLIGMAAHNPNVNMLYAILADRTSQEKLKNEWGSRVQVVHFSSPLRTGKKVYICVPLNKSNDHLPLKENVLR